MQIQVLGPLRVRAGDVDVPISGSRSLRLLAALLIDRNRPVSTDRLVDAVWGDAPPERVANALQARVSRLRRTLAAAGGADRIVTAGGGYRLDVAPDEVDVDRFEAGLDVGQRMLEAGDPAGAREALGRALAEWSGRAYEEVADAAFARPEAARLDELRLVALERRIEADLALDRADAVVGELRAIVEEHPLRERFHALMMTALYRTGRQSEALDVYAALRQRLADELGLDPSPALVALHRAVLAQEVETALGVGPGGGDGGRVAPPPPRAPLPRALTSFVGRRDETKQIRELVDEHPLVTLVGPGGTGKTRLAVEVARAAAPALRDGAALVELAALGSREAVAAHVAGALGALPVLPTAGTSTPPDVRTVERRLVDHLRDRELLVVLDNCEHVIDAAAAIAETIVQHAPEVTVLATSREGLRVPGEVIWPVPPLRVPADDQVTVEDLLDVDAVRLFVDRAGATAPGFVLDTSNAAAVAEVCRRLDGLPLALELAAARVAALPVAELAVRLADRFTLLTGGSRTATRRQQTLEAVVEWSYDLLDEHQRAVFRRLGVFAGGGPADAVAVVCREPDGTPAETLGVVADLADRSLVEAQPAPDGVRYVMLETLREFALRRLVVEGDPDVVRDRHARWCLELAAAAFTGLRGREQVDWLDRLDREHDNLRVALAWLSDRDPTAAATLAADLAWYWWLHDHRAEAIGWLEDLTALSRDLPPAVRARAALWLAFHETFEGVERPDLAVRLEAAVAALADDASRGGESYLLAGYVHLVTGSVDAGAELLDRALAAAEAAGDRWVAGTSRFVAAQLHLLRGETAAALAAAEDAVAVARELADRWIEFQAGEFLGQGAQLVGDYERATAWMQRSLSLGRELGLRDQVLMLEARIAALDMLRGDPEAARRRLASLGDEVGRATTRWAAVTVWNIRGIVERRLGDLDAAEQAYREALEQIGRDSADGAGRAELLAGLAYVAAARGDGDEAERLVLAAAATAGEEPFPLTLALVLEAGAAAALARGDHRLAARRLGRGAACRDSLALPLVGGERWDVDRIADALRSELGAAFEREVDAGRAASTASLLASA